MYTTLLAFGASTVFAFYIYRKFYRHRLFKRLGLPGPEPHWFFGNSFQLLRKDRHLVMADWSARYGPFFGYYLGGDPVLVVNTVDAVESVCVKQFTEFQGHIVLPIQPDQDTDPELPFNDMVFARGDRWKRLRTICNPAFSTGKLKSYMNLISKSQRDLMQLFETKAKLGKNFDIRECYELLTLEVIGEVGFGLELNAIKTLGKGNLILQTLRSLASNVNQPPLFVQLAFCLTELRRVFKFIVFMQLKLMIGFFGPVYRLLKAIEEIVEQRKNGKTRRNDILQMMIDVLTPDNQDLDAEEKKQITGLKALTPPELIAQCLLFFGAGYETTSTSLGFASYLLAKNPDVQEKLAKELRSHFVPSSDGKYSDLDYETVVNNLPYLDWVCHETLRLFPVGMNVMSRFVMTDTSLNGVHVPKDVLAVLIDIWTIHQNPDLWGPVDPKQFYPERFSPENSANRPDSAFLSFGFGPRRCLGMRLALVEMKIALANVLLRYQIAEPDGGYPNGELPITTNTGLMAPVGGVPVKLISRI